MNKVFPIGSPAWIQANMYQAEEDAEWRRKFREIVEILFGPAEGDDAIARAGFDDVLKEIRRLKSIEMEALRRL